MSLEPGSGRSVPLWLIAPLGAVAAAGIAIALFGEDRTNRPQQPAPKVAETTPTPASPTPSVSVSHHWSLQPEGTAANAVHALVAPLCAGQARIKWPNDILVDGAKIAGILLERTGDAVVVGIGINVTHFPQDLDRPVTSLAAQGATGEGADAAALLERLAQLFGHWLAIWRAQGLDPVRTHCTQSHSGGPARPPISARCMPSRCHKWNCVPSSTSGEPP